MGIDKLSYDDYITIVRKTYFVWCIEEHIMRKDVVPYLFSDEFDSKYKEIRDIVNNLSDTLAYEVMKHRLDTFNINIKVSDYLFAIIAFCADGNPGQSLLILHEFLSGINTLYFSDNGITPGFTIDCEMFCEVYDTESRLPVMVNDTIYNAYQKKWEEQKIIPANSWDSDNSLDYPEYWNKLMYRTSDNN